jgi:hypothetical protein
MYRSLVPWRCVTTLPAVLSSGPSRCRIALRADTRARELDYLTIPRTRSAVRSRHYRPREQDLLQLTHIAFLRVGPGLTPAPPVLQSVGSEIETFMGDHIESFLGKVTKESAPPPGRFVEPASEELFHGLLNGTDTEFLEAMGTLGKQLIGAMDRRTAEGILLALRADTEEYGRVAGLLKLRVNEQDGAVLERLESGEDQLSAVTGLLEQPGKVQKGALTTSGIEHDEVYCADSIPEQSMYFPRSLGIRLYAKPVIAARAFFQAVHNHAPNLVRQIATHWPSTDPGPTQQVLSDLGDCVPELTIELADIVFDTLMSHERPANLLDPAQKIDVAYQVGGIKVSGPMGEVHERVAVVEHPEGGWQIIIRADTKPEPTFR